MPMTMKWMTRMQRSDGSVPNTVPHWVPIEFVRATGASMDRDDADATRALAPYCSIGLG